MFGHFIKWFFGDPEARAKRAETEGRNLQDDGFRGTKYSWSEVFRACSSADRPTAF